MSDSTGFWRYRCTVDRVVDGDTIDVTIDLGFNLEYSTRIRLTGVDTAEIYGVSEDSEEYKQGEEHWRFVADWVSNQQEQSEYEYPFVVETRQTGKYGRYLGVVSYRDRDVVLNEEVVEVFPDVASSS